MAAWSNRGDSRLSLSASGGYLRWPLWALFLVCLQCSLSACAPVETPAATAPATLHQAQSRSLCLAPLTLPHASSIDADLQRAQQRAAAPEAGLRSWLAVGLQWQRQARLRADAGFQLNAEACAQLALALSPDSAEAQLLRAGVLLGQHQFEAARQLAGQLMLADPDNASAPAILSDALLELGEYAEAERVARQLHALRPGPAAFARLAWLRWLRGDVKSAKLLWREALVGRSPDDPDGAVWLLTEAAQLYWLEGDAAGAIGLLQEALRWLPDYPPALLNLARIHLAQQRADLALNCSRRVWQLQPGVEAAWLSATAAEALGDRRAAAHWQRRAAQQGRRGDRLGLASYLVERQQDLPRALQLIAQERQGRAGIWLDDLEAWALFRSGEISAALELSRQALRLGTPDPRLHFHAGAIALAAGQLVEARRHLSLALALNPQFGTDAGIARQLLAAVETRMGMR